MLARCSGHQDAQPGLGLGEVQDLRAVREHRRSSLAGVELARVDLSDVGDEVGLDTSGLTRQVGQTAEQLVVRNGSQTRFVSHAQSMGGTPARSGPFASSKRRKIGGKTCSRIATQNGGGESQP